MERKNDRLTGSLTVRGAQAAAELPAEERELLAAIREAEARRRADEIGGLPIWIGADAAPDGRF
jgi:hypothetical protein